MALLPSRLGAYPTAATLDDAWSRVADSAHARHAVFGRSWEGRELRRIDLGDQGAPVVLLSALMHGIELIGGVALLELARALAADEPRATRLRESAHFVILPVVNPDAWCANSSRLERGARAGLRGNARGVDLNRNFPLQSQTRSMHPFSGSRFALSPHYMGPHPLSEPESLALDRVAREVEPQLSLAFHSFGEMLLHPYAFTAKPHPRAGIYRRLGAAMNRAMPGAPYRVKTSRQLYPVDGDLDDHLDAAYGTLAMTVEVGAWNRRALSPRRILQPFCWMNPTDVEGTVSRLTPGLLALLEEATLHDVAPSVPYASEIRGTPVLLAAK